MAFLKASKSISRTSICTSTGVSSDGRSNWRLWWMEEALGSPIWMKSSGQISWTTRTWCLLWSLNLVYNLWWKWMIRMENDTSIDKSRVILQKSFGLWSKTVWIQVEFDLSAIRLRSSVPVRRWRTRVDFHNDCKTHFYLQMSEINSCRFLDFQNSIRCWVHSNSHSLQSFHSNSHSLPSFLRFPRKFEYSERSSDGTTVNTIEQTQSRRIA